MQQLSFDLSKHIVASSLPRTGNVSGRLEQALSEDLDFHTHASTYATHVLHAFPAKFPPQLPRHFIEALTEPGEIVLDPMSGSGTTLLEAQLLGRQALGFDIDPLAVRISAAKTTLVSVDELLEQGYRVAESARQLLAKQRSSIVMDFEKRYDGETRAFQQYWFWETTCLELHALRMGIEAVPVDDIRQLLTVIFSSVIITKSGGVSLALDLAHTRPHRAKAVLRPDGEVLYGAEVLEANGRRQRYVTKYLRSAIDEFEKRLKNHIDSLNATIPGDGMARIAWGNAEALPLAEDSVDLLFTSPPYVSNAIDYMRAHKFSLIWLGFPISELSERRKAYIGGEAAQGFKFEELPGRTEALIQQIEAIDARRAVAVRRYYSEMTRVLRDSLRVLRPGKAALFVVGTSIIRGVDTETQHCLAEIGASVGFDVAGIGIRNLDRDRRMMPAGNQVDLKSQIQQRMHKEFVVGLCKPEERVEHEH